MSQKGLIQAGGVFRCPSGLSCSFLVRCHLSGFFFSSLPIVRILFSVYWPLSVHVRAESFSLHCICIFSFLNLFRTLRMKSDGQELLLEYRPWSGLVISRSYIPASVLYSGFRLSTLSKKHIGCHQMQGQCSFLRTYTVKSAPTGIQYYKTNVHRQQRSRSKTLKISKNYCDITYNWENCMTFWW